MNLNKFSLRKNLLKIKLIIKIWLRILPKDSLELKEVILREAKSQKKIIRKRAEWPNSKVNLRIFQQSGYLFCKNLTMATTIKPMKLHLTSVWKSLFRWSYLFAETDASEQGTYEKAFSWYFQKSMVKVHVNLFTKIHWCDYCGIAERSQWFRSAIKMSFSWGATGFFDKFVRIKWIFEGKIELQGCYFV